MSWMGIPDVKQVEQEWLENKIAWCVRHNKLCNSCNSACEMKQKREKEGKEASDFSGHPKNDLKHEDN